MDHTVYSILTRGSSRATFTLLFQTTFEQCTPHDQLSLSLTPAITAYHKHQLGDSLCILHQ
jgi:hypothetical protein